MSNGLHHGNTKYVVGGVAFEPFYDASKNRDVNLICAQHLQVKRVRGQNRIDCAQCLLDSNAKSARSEPYRYALAQKKGECKRKGIPFDLTLADIPPIPERCPVLGIVIAKPEYKSAETFRSGHSPSMDRIRPELGYVRGNIRWLSVRANMLKCNATVEELKLVLADLERIESGHELDS